MSVSVSAAHEPTIWAGCMHHFNSGHLVGEWFSAVDADTIGLADVHRSGPPATPECEEIWAYDVEGFPEAREMDLLEAARWGALYEEIGDDSWPAFCAWVRSGAYVEDGDGMPSTGDFEERFAGTWPDFRTYAFQLAEDSAMFDGLPEDHVAVRYFDWDSWIRDLKFDYSIEPNSEGGVFIFRDL